MLIAIVSLLPLALAGSGFALLYFDRIRRRVVYEYAIAATDEPIKRLELTLKDEHGMSRTYTLDAPVAHRLSDELLKSVLTVAPRRQELPTSEPETAHG